jgi:copper chaperone
MRFEADNMTCDHCARSIERAIHALDPQASVDVDLAGGTVDVRGLVTAAEVIAALGEEGYPARRKED